MVTRFGLALVLVSIPVFAAATPANMYTCKGADAVVTYSTSTFAGEPRITIRFNDVVLSRSGRDIQIQKTVLGPLVTIVREAAVGRFTDTVTLLAPDVIVTDLAPRVTFPTQLFSTHTITPAVGIPEGVAGVVQSSTSRALACTASAAVF